MNVIELLKARGLFEDMTSPGLPAHLDVPRTVYAGFDPSNDSLQVGNYVQIMVLRHFQRCGHRVIALVGGATGMIGDPSGKDAERALLDEDTVARNAEGIRENLSRFLDFEHPTAPAKLVNNMDWLGKFGYIEFLRDVGKHFRMGAMLGRESVQRRLEGEGGMSYTEFSYQMLQGYDFKELLEREGCTIQVGGSDQWGNIVAGIDLIRRLSGKEAFGYTVPLICDHNGQKFGKSEGNAVFLDARKTSPYDFYQFFLRSDDADAIRFLKVFTEVPIDEIEALAAEHAAQPEGRAAHRRLAEEVTRAVHGGQGLALALAATRVLFGESMRGLQAEQLLSIFADVPSHSLSRDEVSGKPVVDLAAASGLCDSKSAARRLVQNGGLSLNNERVAAVDQVVGAGDIVDGKLVVLKSGKRNYRLVRVRD